MAAGVFFEERRGLVAALHRLLQVQALPAPEGELPEEVAAAVTEFNSGLLMLQSQDRSLLASRLMELIAVRVFPCGGRHLSPATTLKREWIPARPGNRATMLDAGLEPGARA